jgi:UPF0755 protein
LNSRSCRTIALLLGIMALIAAVCLVVVFIAFGDEIVDRARDVVRDVRLAMRADELNAPAGSDPTPRQFEVSEGQGAGQIAEALFAAGLVNDSDLFVDYVISEDFTARLRSGTYFLNQTMSIKDVAEALVGLEYRAIEFTVFGGQRIEEIAEAIDSTPRFGFSGAEFLTVVGRGAGIDPTIAARLSLPPGASLEGFLLPGRYILPPGVTAFELRNRMVDAFLQAVESENLPAEAQSQGYTIYEVVTLASIVQREARHDDERPLIAGVYRNRLERPDPDTRESPPMNLDADPTVQYPIGQAGDWWPQITQADYQSVDSEYNTYRREGLPPGPISSAGIESIRAVVFPESSDFFYFRADCRGDGYHDFAPNFQEHLNNGC